MFFTASLISRTVIHINGIFIKYQLCIGRSVIVIDFGNSFSFTSVRADLNQISFCPQQIKETIIIINLKSRSVFCRLRRSVIITHISEIRITRRIIMVTVCFCTQLYALLRVIVPIHQIQRFFRCQIIISVFPSCNTLYLCSPICLIIRSVIF